MVKIPQMPDASGESLVYTGGEGIYCWKGRMRLLLADDRPRIRFALRALLAQQAGLTVVGEAADAAELLALAQEHRPDLVLLGWGLRGLPAAELVPALRSLCPHAHLIALSSRLEVRQTALAAGADAFVSKMDPPEQLLRVVAHCEHRSGHE
jgi:DNA-binding NarL/FixJ family response regulator